MPVQDRTREPLSGIDAAMIDLETPANLMLINAVMILAAPLTLDDLKAVVRDRFTPIGRFRQRVARNPGRRPTLYWEDDPALDVDNHVYRIALPGSSLPSVSQMSAMLDDALATLDALLGSPSTMPALV